MNKIYFLFLAVLLLLSTEHVWAITLAAPAGSGTVGDPYQIATLNDLAWFQEQTSAMDKHYIQTADINAPATVTDLWNGGNGFIGIGSFSLVEFTGTYDGQGHTITGLSNNNGEIFYFGFFRKIGAAGIVSNLGLVDINFEESGNVGGIAGQCGGTIHNCYATGTININGGGPYFGGLVGELTGSIINSYSTVTVAGNESVGGLVGYLNSGTISNSYSTGSVTGDNNVGGLIGKGDGGNVSNCFWNTDNLASGATSSGGTGITTAQMKTQTTFTSWDYPNVWNIDASKNNGYPYLKWQYAVTAAPVATAATIITTTGFTANWGTVAGATSYLLEVSADNFASQISGSPFTITAPSVAKDIADLTAGTAYTYRVKAVDAGVASDFSNEIDITTVPAAPNATAVTNIISTGFTANWDAVAGATSYSLEVSADDFATQISGSPFTISAPTVTNAFTGMSAGTIYKYRLKATNASGSSGYGNVVTVTTLVPPTITDFSPEADVVGGTIVTITGTDFTGATAVSFGGVAASSFAVVSPTSITAVVAPAGASGNVSVTTPGGTVSLAGFTFLPPTSISSFSPASATTGQTVTIIGSGFTGVSEVTFGGSAAKSFEVVSSTSITAVVANGTSGDVSVTAAGGTGSKAGFTFNLCLEITAPANITVNVAPGSTGAIVNYTTPVGTNPCGYSKSYGCTYAVQTYTVPAGIYSVDYNLSGGRGGLGLTPIPGVYGSYYDVPGGYGGNITGKLAVNPGDVINVFVGDAGQSPHYNNSGSNYNGGGTYGYCNSGNFYGFGGNGGGATDLRIGGIALNNRVVVAGGGGGGGGANISSHGGAGGGSTGAMGAGQQANYGGGGGSQIAGGAAGGAGVATAYVTAGTFGVGGNGGGSLGGVNDNGGGGGGGYYGGGGGYWGGGGGGSNYPNIGIIGNVTVLTSSQGTNSGSGQAIISYSLGGTPSTTLTEGLASGTTFPVGTTNVTYTVTDGLGNSKSATFKVTVNRIATITNFTPTIATSGQTVTITGIDFTGATAVSFGGTPAASFSVVSSTTITAIVPAGTSGNVSVTTPAGTVSQAGFTFLPPPTITSFSPANATTNQTVNITGTNFTGATSVSFGGVSAISYSVVNSTTITAVVPGACTSGDVSVNTPIGNYSLAGFTFDLCLQITAPTVLPVTIPAGQSGAVVNYATPVGINTCNFTQTYTLPGAYQLTIPTSTFNYDLTGAKGGKGHFRDGATPGLNPESQGGLGGNMTGTYTVTPGQLINIFVGGEGYSPYSGTGSQPAFNGGGNGTSSFAFMTVEGGGGGGATDIRIGGTALTDRKIVAGGGGGGRHYTDNGGPGGGLTGGGGTGLGYNPGKGGSQIAGGAGGGDYIYSMGSPGTLGNGGNASYGNPDFAPLYNGGGGGGGYYGGGGGSEGSGGGGSNYPTAGTQGYYSSNGNGTAIISYNRGGTPVTSLTAGLASGSTFPVGTTLITYTVTDEYGNSTSCSFNVVVNREPTITNFSPTIATSGQSVTITGTDFTGATAVSFGGTPAASFTVVSSTTITAIVPAGTSGNVSVTTPASTVSLSGFTYTIIPPSTVLSVSVPADGTYVEGQTLDFTVNYNENVTVSSTGDMPYIPIILNTGGTVHANYNSGSGSSELVFRYTVVSGNEDLDGITLGTAINTNGGTIERSEGGGALLTLNNSGSTTQVKVDAASPLVSSIIRLNPSGSSTNVNSITYRITFSENVNGVDVSDFSLTATGGSSGTIASVSASGGNSLDVTVNSITGDGSLRLDVNNSGTGITDDAGNALNGGYNSGNAYTIDQTASTVSSVGVPANARYTSGQNIDLVVNYREAVNVVTTGGIPYIPITLNSGGTAKAFYVSGSGSSALTFRYTVAYGDYDDDGITIGSSVVANGGTIKDDAGNDAILALNGVGSTAGILVDGVVAPTTQASSLVFPDVQGTQMTIDWTNGSGWKRIVFVKEANTGSVTPVNNSSYTANTVFAGGSQIPAGWYCVYNGTGTSVTVTGLSIGTDYIAEVLEYNGPAGFEKYFAATSANNPKTQATPMCANPTDGGTIATDQNGCIPYDVSLITNTALPLGNVGILEYKWQKSETSSSTGFTDIANSNQSTYNPGVITVNTWYKRLARVTCMSNWSGAAESNVVKISVTPPPVGGSVSGGTSPVMYGEGTGTLTLKDYYGSITKWQKRLASGVWTDIASTSGTFNDTSGSIGTWEYRAVVTNGFCSETYSEPFSIVVTPRLLTITANSLSKTYGEVDPELTYAFAPELIGTDVLTGKLGRQAGENVGLYAINIGTLSASANYKLTFVSNDLKITPKQLVISDLMLTTSKTYDATTTAKVIAGTLTGVIAGDERNVDVAAVANYDTPIVGNGKAIDVVYSLMGTASGNYTKPAGYHASSGEIVAKQLSISNTIVATNKMYDGTTDVEVESVGLLLGVESDEVSITAVASYDNASVGASKTITVVYTLSGPNAGNYIVPADLQISNAKISEPVVLKALLSATSGCQGSELELSYTILSGMPAQYQIIFGKAALSAGFQHVHYTNLPSADENGVISVSVPAGTPYGVYEASLQMRNELGVESNSFPFQFVVNVFSDFIVPKFDDVLVCNNVTNRFVAFQWYKNGNEIVGANEQYYSDPDGLIGSYSLKLKTTDGLEFYTCPKVLNIPIKKNISVSVAPNPVKINQESKVEIIGMNDEELKGAVMNIFNIQGVLTYSTRNVEEINSLILQNKEGNYIGHITTVNGKDYSFRILLVK